MSTPVEWHASTIPAAVRPERTTISISKYDPATERTYIIQLCPTISLSVWLHDEEAKQRGSNKHIYGIIQVNNDKDFDRVWKMIAEELKKEPTTAFSGYDELTFADKNTSMEAKK